MKHANKQLEMLGTVNGESESFKDGAKTHFVSDEKKIRKGNIDILTGKRKYTKKLLKLDSLSPSEFVQISRRRFLLTLWFTFRIERKKEAQEAKWQHVDVGPPSRAAQIYIQETTAKNAWRWHVRKEFPFNRSERLERR